MNYAHALLQRSMDIFGNKFPKFFHGTNGFTRGFSNLLRSLGSFLDCFKFVAHVYW